MPRTTLADAKNSRLPASVGACASDPRFLQILNEAQQRLITKGHWWGTVARYRFCATDGCITFPRGLATLEGAALCGQPITLRDYWYEFLEAGAGIRSGASCQFTGSSGTQCSFNMGCCSGEAIMRNGHVCTFNDLQGTNKKLRWVCDLAADVGKKVLCLGQDNNTNWIRTTQGGVMSDGEAIVLAQAPGTDSTKFFTTLSDIQFPSNMTGQTWLYELNTDTGAQRMIGHYNYDDTRPSYRRYFLPSVRAASTSNGSCSQTLLEVIAKLDYVAAVNDTDYLVIGNLPALKTMCEGINLSEIEPDGVKKLQILLAAEVAAMKTLDEELSHYLGDGRRTGMTIVGSSIGDIIPVEQLQ